MKNLRRKTPAQIADWKKNRSAAQQKKDTRAKRNAAIDADLKSGDGTYHEIAKRHKTGYTIVARRALAIGLVRNRRAGGAIVIEDDVPLPGVGSVPWDKLKPGQSVLVTVQVDAVEAEAQRRAPHFVTERREGGIRVWRSN